MGEGRAGGRFREVVGQLRQLPRAVALCRRAAPGLTAAWSGLLVLQGTLPAAAVFATKMLVDAVVARRDPAEIAGFVAAAGGLLLLGEVLRSVLGFVRTAQAERIRDHLAGVLQERSVAADLAFYETPEQHDRLHRAREEARYRPLALLESLGAVLSNSITMAAMAVVLLRFGVLLPAALVLSTLPALWVALAASARLHRFRRLRTADERRALYLDGLLTGGAAAAEVRLFDLGGHLRGLFRELRDRLRAERIGLARRQAAAESVAGVFGVVVSAAAFGLVALRAARGTVTLGELALFWQTFHTGQRLMRSLLADVGLIYGSALFLGDFFEFLGLEPAIVSPAAPLAPPPDTPCGAEFRDVTFRYPGAERPVLDRFSLALPAGKITALLGPNGSGKSTLVKLLCRLYDPDEGRVELGGIDLRRLSLPAVRERISALFQEPVHYHASVADNIAFGAAGHALGPGELAEAARAAGAEELIGSLPRGSGTMLGKLFAGGVELSTGEWQRLALARAMARRTPILVLDEPTSAMDPWSEAKWGEALREAVRGRTVLLITHRLSTARHADIVHRMDAGRLD
jgi:ATP-binding cassette subfamily B protein